MQSLYTVRLQNFQQLLSSSQVVLISKPADICYFTGFITLVPEEREAYLLISSKQVHLLHTSFSPVTQLEGISYTPSTALETLSKTISEVVAELGLTVDSANILIDENNLFVSEYQSIKTKLNTQLHPLPPQKIWQLRMIKDEQEQAATKAAATLTIKAYTHLQQFIQEGATELELAWEIESYIKQKNGVLAFPTIVAFGEHAALPHHQPTATALKKETAVLLDFGAKVDGYCADMTRTIWFGDQPTKEFAAAQTAVMAAYAAGLSVCKNYTTQDSSEQERAVPVSEIDTAARQALEQAGFGKEFIHTTGHGLGLEIHEPPSIYKSTPTLLKPGMLFTIEPGVYLPGKFGFRYENTVLVSKNEVQELTATAV